MILEADSVVRKTFAAAQQNFYVVRPPQLRAVLLVWPGRQARRSGRGRTALARRRARAACAASRLVVAMGRMNWRCPCWPSGPRSAVAVARGPTGARRSAGDLDQPRARHLCRQQDHEGRATAASNGVGRAHAGRYPAGAFEQDQVAGRMTAPLVEKPEIVQLDQQQGRPVGMVLPGAAPAAGGPGRGPGQAARSGIRNRPCAASADGRKLR